jgi:hypothetical protein
LYNLKIENFDRHFQSHPWWLGAAVTSLGLQPKAGIATKRREKAQKESAVSKYFAFDLSLRSSREAKNVKKFFCLAFGYCLLVLSACGQEVTLTIDTQSPTYEIPADFAGVSIFTGTQVRDHKGVPGNLFSGANTQLITLFKNSGLHHLRLGATGSVNSGSRNLSHDDIDALFAFAKATDIKVIYSLHYADGVETAKYVWAKHRPCVDCFAFDNEPDNRLEGGSGAAVGNPKDYFTTWREFAEAVVEAVPGAKFAGPDAAGRTLVKRFVAEEKDSGALALITQHTYVGGNPRKRGIDREHAIENMLSRVWVTNNYPELYRSVLKPVQQQGFRFRITELDDHVHGVTNASDAFVAALWALDCMHWWAAHGASGVNFQNTEWLRTDTFYPDAQGNYRVRPKAYGIKAFDLGSRGHVTKVSVENKGDLNVRGYAVSDGTNLFVTIINKEHGAGAREAKVRILVPGFGMKSAARMDLAARDGSVEATEGITLGGGVIANDAPWEGKWRVVDTTKEGCEVIVPVASVALVKASK